jgi:hypothetical protein
MKTNIEPGGELSTHQLPDVAQSQYREVPLPDFYLVSATSEQKPIIARQSKEVADWARCLFLRPRHEADRSVSLPLLRHMVLQRLR